MRPAPRAPLRASARRAALRVRWDRVGRVGLLVTLGIVVCLYIQPALSILTTWRAERRQAAVVHQLLHSNAALERQVRSLNQPLTIAADARTLGMVLSGEKPYVVLGLPK
jgi:cell division protein FtsB